MEKLPRQVYTTELRRQAVELVTREGLGRPHAPPRGHRYGGRTLPAAAGERRTADGARHLKKCMAPPSGSSAARTMSHEVGRMQ